MAYAGGPHHVFKIHELTRLVAIHLTSIGPGSAVNFARASRYLEEPVLSAVWETQSSFGTLLKVLPGVFFVSVDVRSGPITRWCSIVGDPPREAWSRVHRYASWMRQAQIELFGLKADALRLVLRNSPPGGWFPALQELFWAVEEANIPYCPIFFSPQLRRVHLFTNWRGDPTAPPDLSAVASAVSQLPASTLKLLNLHVRFIWFSSLPFEESASSLVLRCGPSLTRFSTRTQLSDEALNHLVQLPYLDTVLIDCPPPRCPGTSFPPIFPRLKKLSLGKAGAHGWLSLFGQLENGISAVQGVMPLSRMKKSLVTLKIITAPAPGIDAAFTSVLQIFQNLAILNLDHVCHEDEEDDQCKFTLNDNDVTELAMALPRLRTLILGYPCAANTCATTIACLLPISVHCVGLESLSIHFNTRNIAKDLETAFEDPRFQELRLLPRCPLGQLRTFDMTLSLDESGFETVVNGMVDIFPSLNCCEGNQKIWSTLSTRIVDNRAGG